MENILRAGATISTAIKRPVIGWFEESHEKLQPIIAEKNKVLSAMRTTPLALKNSLREKLKIATEKVKDAVAIAKSDWSRKKAERIHQMCYSPSQAWTAIKELATRDNCHHNKPVTMKMRKEDGNLATSDKENLDVFTSHFDRVYNALRKLAPHQPLLAPPTNLPIPVAAAAAHLFIAWSQVLNLI